MKTDLAGLEGQKSDLEREIALLKQEHAHFSTKGSSAADRFMLLDPMKPVLRRGAQVDGKVNKQAHDNDDQEGAYP